MKDKPHVYLRVGPDGSEHTSFILDLATECGMKLFTKRTRTPMKMFNRESTKFEDTIGRCKEKKMVAFIDTPVKKMCFIKNLKHLEHVPSCIGHVDTWIFSVSDKGMQSSVEADAEDILVHLFGKDELESHQSVLHLHNLEIQHVLPNGKVRILACGGKKLEDAIVLSHKECTDRMVVALNSSV